MKQEAIYSFLKGVSPINTLEDSLIQRLAEEVEIKEYPKGEQLFLQAKSPIHHLYIIKKGSVRLVDEQSQELYDLLTEGEHFGGVAMLLKDSRAFRTASTQEDTQFYLIGEETFLEICETHENFTQYFSNTLSRALVSKAQRNGSLIKSNVSDISLFTETMETIGKHNPVFCPGNITIRDAAIMMTEKRVDYLIVCNEKQKPAGIVTDVDFRKKVVVQGMSIEEPVQTIMNQPLNTISHSAVEIEGLMTMLTEGIHHLVVTKNGVVSGIATHDDFMANQGFSPVSLGKKIEKAKKVFDLRSVFKKIPSVVQGLIQGGLHAESVSKVISALNDKIMERVLKLAEESMPTPPPVNYCFMVLGSEGRQEQTFKTDQDNAIIRAPSPAGEEEAVEAWFKEFSEKVCKWLDRVGFPYCPGDIMAQNPKWNQPIEVWKAYFEHWITVPRGEELLNSTIFFDFRPVYGDLFLAQQLSEHLTSIFKKGAPIFFANFARECGKGSTPLSFFRTFVVEKTGEHKSELDLKHNGSAIIVDIARIFALRYGIRETNTVDRIRRVRSLGGKVLMDSDSLLEAYHFIMTLRLKHQIQQVREGVDPDNYINPSNLNLIEKKILKESFQVISQFQEKTVERYCPGGIR